KNNVLAYTAHLLDPCAIERSRNLLCRRLQRLRLLAQPHGLDHITGDAGVESVGDSLDFGKFRHQCRPILMNCCGYAPHVIITSHTARQANPKNSAVVTSWVECGQFLRNAQPTAVPHGPWN